MLSFQTIPSKRHTSYLILFMVFFSSCMQAQTTISDQKLTGDIKKDLTRLLPIGAVKADIIDGVRQNPRQMELAKKLQSSIAQNYEWFVDYMKAVPQGEKIPYHAKLGLTKEEYMELINFMDNIEMVSTGKENIAIQIKNDMIYFKSQNKLSKLDSLTIDLKNNMVSFGKIKMPFADKLNITTDKNALKSKWEGYSWILEEPKDVDANAMKDLNSLKMRQYKFTIGKLEKTGKTYMSLKGREIENGTKTIDFELPVQF
ncbi:hypothetical protein [Pedobacter zeae]|uniref:Uncharacterized protein n=2 Tax=Pedobacter zeae TaxID=1737356 RepID=A0A7W6KGE7_9SPHI|nr:hypothetical protein [Pedobacter zeae]MBB4110225.1 hypothetical protein [Pedobacter zeae]